MELKTDIFSLFNKEWALVTAGTPERFNTMTVSWGGAGTLWGKSVVTVYVKPVRYTHEFLEANDFFTVSFYPEDRREALMLLGSRSGRDGDKVAEAGLTPEEIDGAVTFKEAHTTLLCRKIYRQDMDVSAMPERVADTFYRTEAAHTMYIGEVVRIVRK